MHPRSTKMTPSINYAMVASRSLFETDPDYFFAKLAVIDPRIKRCRLSDFVVMALAVLFENGYLDKLEVAWFETAYCLRDGSLLVNRANHKNTELNRPARALMVCSSIS